MDDPATARERIRDKALDLGFDTVGFTKARLSDDARMGLREFLTAGHHGDMRWLAEKRDRRGDPRTLWKDARSIVVLGLSYAPAGDPLKLLGQPQRGAISVYAQGRDYHDVVKKKLKAVGQWLHHAMGAEIKVFVDTAPVMEKPLAQGAGLGWQGKHTNLVSRRYGSWLFLGEIYTNLDLAPDDAAPHEDLCGSCEQCRNICPTAALTSPNHIDARRCISYLTIEHQGPIDRELRPLMGNRIYGCDDCLAVCPWNKFATPATEPDLRPRIELSQPRLGDLARLTDADFRSVFAGSPVKRLGRDRFVRNVLIAIGNSGAISLAATAEALLDDPAPVVRGAAVWAAHQLLSEDAFQDLKILYQRAESDPEVSAEWDAN